MRVLVAGASGAIGTRLVPQLIQHGHEVLGTTTSARGLERLRALGAEAIVLDLLDPPPCGGPCSRAGPTRSSTRRPHSPT